MIISIISKFIDVIIWHFSDYCLHFIAHKGTAKKKDWKTKRATHQAALFVAVYSRVIGHPWLHPGQLPCLPYLCIRVLTVLLNLSLLYL